MALQTGEAVPQKIFASDFSKSNWLSDDLKNHDDAYVTTISNRELDKSKPLMIRVKGLPLEAKVYLWRLPKWYLKR